MGHRQAGRRSFVAVLLRMTALGTSQQPSPAVVSSRIWHEPVGLPFPALPAKAGTQRSAGLLKRCGATPGPPLPFGDLRFRGDDSSRVCSAVAALTLSSFLPLIPPPRARRGPR